MSKVFDSKPLPNQDGYYYIRSADDTGAEIWQVFWSEDGAQMQVNVPAGLMQGSAPMPVRAEKTEFPYPAQ